MTIEAPLDRSRRETFREAILNRRMLICVFTGFHVRVCLYTCLIQLVPALLQRRRRWARGDRVLRARCSFPYHVEISMGTRHGPLHAAILWVAGAAGCWLASLHCCCRLLQWAFIRPDLSTLDYRLPCCCCGVSLVPARTSCSMRTAANCYRTWSSVSATRFTCRRIDYPASYRERSALILV